MSAPSAGWGTGTTAELICGECGHESDEHTGTRGACIAYVIQFGRETFCACRVFMPVTGD